MFSMKPPPTWFISMRVRSGFHSRQNGVIRGALSMRCKLVSTSLSSRAAITYIRTIHGIRLCVAPLRSIQCTMDVISTPCASKATFPFYILTTCLRATLVGIGRMSGRRARMRRRLTNWSFFASRRRPPAVRFQCRWITGSTTPTNA